MSSSLIMSQPLVSVRKNGEISATSTLPAVFSTPIRLDIIHDVFTAVNKNKRQAYAVGKNSGEQTSATSWGTGRALARIPRVGGSGTYRSGQAAFGNMCRDGRMFAPTKTWRRWNVKVNQNEKRYATAAAIAASAVAPLVLARGHRIEQVPEVPLVVSSEVESLKKTKEAVAFLKTIGAQPDVAKVLKTKKLRAGKGKLRGRRHTQRRGPLVVYGEDKGLVKAFRNIPGVEVAQVDTLSVLNLAPGAHLGRFVIWTEDAFKQLDKIWGSDSTKSAKSGFHLPKNIVSNADITGLINSSEIQSALKPKGDSKTHRAGAQKKNPLRNKEALYKLNPYAKAYAEKKLGQVKADATKSKTPAEFKALLRQD